MEPRGDREAAQHRAKHGEKAQGAYHEKNQLHPFHAAFSLRHGDGDSREWRRRTGIGGIAFEMTLADIE